MPGENGSVTITIMQGDITTADCDAIVNAANEALLPGGGVCGAIHRAAGLELAQACAAIGGCKTGNAVITPGFRLKARHVIHAAGPRWQGGQAGEAALLESCYASVFDLVEKHGLQSIALPAISTGIFGYPPEPAAVIAVKAARAFAAGHPGVAIVFVCFDDKTRAAYDAALA